MKWLVWLEVLCRGAGELRGGHLMNWESMCLVAQSCLTLCDPMDCSPPGSSVHEDVQARILKWVAMPSSRGSSRPTDRTQVSCIAGGFFTIRATREVCWWNGRSGLYFPGSRCVIAHESCKGHEWSAIYNSLSSPEFASPWFVEHIPSSREASHYVTSKKDTELHKTLHWFSSHSFGFVDWIFQGTFLSFLPSLSLIPFPLPNLVV